MAFELPRHGERGGILERDSDETLGHAVPHAEKGSIITAVEYLPGHIENMPVQETADAIPWKKYIRRINYSACNEDTGSEIAALQPAPGKRLIGITAGGGRILDLLINKPDEIWAVDVNPCQNHLFELKVEALRALDHEDFLAFLGVRPSDGRRKTYEREIRPHLSPGAALFFDQHPRMIAKGVLFSGHLEKFFSTIAAIVHLTRPSRIIGLFGCEDLESQRRFIEREWNTRLWNLLGPNLCRRSFIHLFGDDPGFLRFLPNDLVVHRRVFDAINSYIWNNVARESHVLQLVFFGKYIYEPAMPLYLRQSTFGQIQEALKTTRIKVATAFISDVLASAPADTFDAFSLTDIASYLSEPVFHRLVANIVRTARPEARLCLRRCLLPLQLPAQDASVIQRDTALEERLKLHDHAIVHEFLVGKIKCGA